MSEGIERGDENDWSNQTLTLVSHSFTALDDWFFRRAISTIQKTGQVLVVSPRKMGVLNAKHSYLSSVVIEYRLTQNGPLKAETRGIEASPPGPAGNEQPAVAAVQSR